MLLTINEVSERLRQLFSDAPFDISDFIIREPGLSNELIQRLEDALDARLPESFIRVLRRYAVGGISFGSARLGRREYAGYLIDENGASAIVPWWGAGDRPHSHIMIGTSDAFVFLLDLHGGKVWAMRHGDALRNAQVVAGDFELFVRGLGTSFLVKANAPDAAGVIASAVLAEHPQFWEAFSKRRV